MDFLPYLDQPAGIDYDSQVDRLIQDVLKNKDDQLHPEAQKLLSKTVIPPPKSEYHYEFYSQYDDNQGWKRKRKETEDATLDESRKKQRGVDLNRYDIETDNLESLQVVDSYLRHQTLVLQTMNETTLNQWAINNDYMERASENLRDRINHQTKQLQDLDRYRESVQLKHSPHLQRIKNSWKQQLIENLKQ